MLNILEKRWLRIFLLLFIFSIALLLRIQYVNKTDIIKPIVADAQQYVIYGYNIIHHGVYSKEIDNPIPDSFRSPGYPLFIALAILLGGDQGYYPIVIFTQVILSSLLVLLTYYIGSLFLRSYYALFAATLVAFCPHIVSISSYILTETLFSFFLLASICCFMVAKQKKRLYLFLFAALLFGYTYLINETALLIPFLFVLISWLSFKPSFKRFREDDLAYKLILALLLFTLFPTVWSIRNNISLSPDAQTGSQRATSTLSHGAYPGFIYKNPQFKYFPYREDPMQPQFGSSFKSFRRILWLRFKENPVRYISWYIFEKPYYLWSWNILQGQGDVYVYPVKTSLYKSSNIADMSREIMKLLHPVLVILALIGLVLMLALYRKGGNKDNIIMAFFPLSICIYYTLIYMITAPWPRYSVPLRPELYLLSIWCAENLIKRIIK